VRATVVESLESRFTISARVVGEEALIEWEYLERDVLGVSPPGGRPFARRELGALRLDLETAETRPVDRGEPTAAADEPLPPPVERLVVSGELRLPPWRAGEVLAAAQQLYDPGRERLVLRRWRADTGEALPEVTLLEGRAVAVLPAGDRRHLLVVAPPEALPEAAGRYLWTIHSLATGEAVSNRRAERSATPFCLLGDTLVYLEPPSGRRVEGRWVEAPLRLRAIGPDGVELWQEEVRDPTFRGPAPPRQ
jgi:hypothetical protein